MTERRERRGGDGWPRICLSTACVWCRRAMIRSRWNGICDWSAEATTWSLAIIRAAPIRPVHKSPSLTAAESWLPAAISTVMFAGENRASVLVMATGSIVGSFIGGLLLGLVPSPVLLLLLGVTLVL
jgi:hypothetical protein